MGEWSAPHTHITFGVVDAGEWATTVHTLLHSHLSSAIHCIHLKSCLNDFFFEAFSCWKTWLTYVGHPVKTNHRNLIISLSTGKAVFFLWAIALEPLKNRVNQVIKVKPIFDSLLVRPRFTLLSVTLSIHRLLPALTDGSFISRAYRSTNPLRTVL